MIVYLFKKSGLAHDHKLNYDRISSKIFSEDNYIKMKMKKILAVLVAGALTSGVVFTACKPREDHKPDTAVEGSTPYGNKTITDEVKDPSSDVTIRLIRGKNVLDKGVNSLSYVKALQAGDIIELSSDYRYLKINLFEKLGEQIIYTPTGRLTYQIPSSQTAYASGTFGGTSHLFTASALSDAEVESASNDVKNLALNPYDFMYIDEKNDQTATTMSADLKNSETVENGETTAFPHAYANRVTRNEAGFFARNAIDGVTASDGHGDSPYQSWGYDKKTDAEFVVYFGREVILNKVAFVLRADFSGTKEHDTYWQDATVEFSDGTTQTIEFEKTGAKQEFELSSEVKTDSVRIRNIHEKQNPNSEMYAALTEFETYGKEDVKKNEAVTRTTIQTVFGGKEQNAFSTSEYSYADVKAKMDKANAWFINKTESEDYKIPDYNGNPMQVKINDAGWKDAVYYSGLSEAFLTTGDMNSYYFLRAVGEQFKYKNNGGSHTAHGDYYQIGETYLQLNDLKSADYKLADTLANADWNLTRDPNDTSFTGFSSAKSADKKSDWQHMGFWWCDALYMSMNTYTLLSRQTGDKKYANAAYEGYTYWKGILYNKDYKLWYRDQGEMGKTTGHVDPVTKKEYPVFWARGNAWVLAALAKQLLYLDPETYPELYAAYRADYIELAESIAKYQRTDGTWNVSIVDENFYGGKETTGTCGFIYAYCVGLRLGLLPSDIYYPIVSKAYDCIISECMFESGQVGYMQTTGYQPQNYKSEEYSKTNTHEFGMGLFLLACSGMMSICSDYTTPNVVLPADPQAALL